jgi:hypothetical protein
MHRMEQRNDCRLFAREHRWLDVLRSSSGAKEHRVVDVIAPPGGGLIAGARRCDEIARFKRRDE